MHSMTRKRWINLTLFITLFIILVLSPFLLAGPTCDCILGCKGGTEQSYLNGPVEEEWTERYRCNGDGHDSIRAMVIDSMSNVYVTGSGDCSGGHSLLAFFNNALDDYMTVKYNADGKRLWVASYGGTKTYSQDKAFDLAIDGMGNVYVTGGSLVWGKQREDGITMRREDGITIKYDSAGYQLWTANYSIGSNEYSNEYAGMRAIAVDKGGNVYVTGTAATVKYDADGNQLWARATTGEKICVDQLGNIYVMRNNGVVKHDRDGNQLWIVYFDIVYKGFGGVRDMVIDDSGNVYITGLSNQVSTTIKYSSDGEEIWVVSNNASNAIALDEAGNVYVTGHSKGDYVTVKYDNDGTMLWVAEYHGMGYDITIDDLGNVYVTGQSDEECTTIKYNREGDQQWVARYDGGLSDYGGNIAIDGLGNVYIAGSTDVKECWNVGSYVQYSEYLVIKYSQ